MPRNRPPFPVTHGYLRQPTVVNNVETFCAAALIAVHGGDWYAAIGTREVRRHQDPLRVRRLRAARALRISVRRDACGRCSRTAAPRDTQAVQVGGPSGVLPRRPTSSAAASPSRTCRPPAPSWCSTRSRDMFEVARNFAHFFAHESCGFCTPCRVGTSLLVQRDGQARRRATARRTTCDEIDRAEPAAARRQPLRPRRTPPATRCSTRCKPSARPTSGGCSSLDFEPAFDLDGALARARQMTGRDDAGAHLEAAAVSERADASCSTATTCPSSPGRRCCRRRSPPGATSRTCATTRNSRRTAAASSAPSRSTAAPSPPAPRRAEPGMEVESDTEELNEQRRTLVQMLFVEGNHFCPSCEKSGNCLLQALGYDLGMMTPHFDHFYPGPAGRRLASRDPARLQPLHPVRAVRARQPRRRRQERLRARRARHRQAPDRQRGVRPARRHRRRA